MESWDGMEDREAGGLDMKKSRRARYSKSRLNSLRLGLHSEAWPSDTEHLQEKHDAVREYIECEWLDYKRQNREPEKFDVDEINLVGCFCANYRLVLLFDRMIAEPWIRLDYQQQIKAIDGSRASRERMQKILKEIQGRMPERVLDPFEGV